MHAQTEAYIHLLPSLCMLPLQHCNQTGWGNLDLVFCTSNPMRQKNILCNALQSTYRRTRVAHQTLTAERTQSCTISCVFLQPSILQSNVHFGSWESTNGFLQVLQLELQFTFVSLLCGGLDHQRHVHQLGLQLLLAWMPFNGAFVKEKTATWK